MSTTALPGSVTILHQSSSEPGGKADAFLQTQRVASQKGQAGKVSLPCLHTDSLCQLLLKHVPFCSLCPSAQLLETHCPERWGWKALRSGLLQLHPCELKQTRPALHQQSTTRSTINCNKLLKEYTWTRVIGDYTIRWH